MVVSAPQKRLGKPAYSGQLFAGGRATAEDNQLGANVRDLRVRRGISQEDLARESDISLGQIARIEQGKTPHPRGDTASKLAAALGTTVDALYTGRGLPTVSGGAREAAPSWAVTMPASAYIQLVAPVAAGSDQFAISGTGEYVAVPEEWSRGHQLVAARVVGTCMEPEIMDGDTAIIDTANLDPKDGQVVAVLTGDGELILKRFHRIQGMPILIDNNNRTYSLDGAILQGVLRHTMRSYN